MSGVVVVVEEKVYRKLSLALCFGGEIPPNYCSAFECTVFGIKMAGEGNLTSKMTGWTDGGPVSLITF